MTARILQGDVFEQLPTIAPRSVDCVVTSPPFWMLRRYLPVGHPLAPQEIGQEPTPGEFVAKIVRVMGLVRNAMADHAVAWLNMGDTYADDSKWGGATGGKHVQSLHGQTGIGRERVQSGINPGNLCLIPQRLAIALQDDGWICRSYVIWQKPSAMPASLSGWSWRRCRVKDTEWSDCPGCKKCTSNGGYVLRRGSWRATSSYEPILMLAKTADYFADGEPVKTPAAEATISRDRYTRILEDANEQFAVAHDHETTCDSGANLRDVWRTHLEEMSKEELIDYVRGMDDGNMSDLWRIAAEPLRDELHYASYPTELVRRCLQSSTSERGYCVACGAPWARVVESKAVPHPSPRAVGREIDSKGGNQASGSASLAPDTKTIGWRASCRCKAETRPGLVLDPFCGSGRTGIAANRLGLDFIGIDLNPEYANMSIRRLHDESPLFS